MGRDRAILCGGAAAARLPVADPDPLRLALFGDRANVRLRVEAVRREMVREVPDEFLDLLDLAAYVSAADRAVGRGGSGVLDLGAGWRRLFFRVPVRRPGRWADWWSYALRHSSIF